VSLGRIRSEVERQVAKGDGRLNQDMQLTPRAKRVIDLAYDEARQLNNNYIGTEHLLLGLIREGEGLAGRTLAKLGLDLVKVREVVRQMQAGGAQESGDGPRSVSEAGELSGHWETAIDGSPRSTFHIVGPALQPTGAYSLAALRVLMRAYSEAARLGQDLVRSEHLLLSMVREPHCLGARILAQFGVSPADLLFDVEEAARARSAAPEVSDPEPSPTLTHIVAYASAAAAQMSGHVTGSEHLLLAMIRDGESTAGQHLSRLGVTLPAARDAAAAARAASPDAERE
jgi:ATP-dependent Clp protease ATP-binding subunit ClpA